MVVCSWFLGACRIGELSGGFPTRFFHLEVPPRSAWHPGTPKDPLEVRLFVCILHVVCCLSVAPLNLCLGFSSLRLRICVLVCEFVSWLVNSCLGFPVTRSWVQVPPGALVLHLGEWGMSVFLFVCFSLLLFCSVVVFVMGQTVCMSNLCFWL
jgi:hypothetical protein